MGTVEIVFLVLDIIGIFIIFFQGKICSKAAKAYKEKSLLSVAPCVLSVVNPGLAATLIIVFIIEFVIVSELAYKIHFYKTEPIVKKKTDTKKPYELYHYEGQVIEEEKKD